MKALGGVAVADIPHAEYDRLYVVVHEAGKPPRVVETRLRRAIAGTAGISVHVLCAAKTPKSGAYGFA